jgi:hypothetical protein
VVTLTATVTAVAPGGAFGAPTGTVTFSDGNVSLGAVALNATGVATLSTGGLSAGRHLIAASYGGSATYNPSSNALLQVIVATASIAVQQGWNLVTMPLLPAAPLNASAVLGGVLQTSHGSTAAIYGLTNGQWSPSLVAHAGTATTPQDFTLQPGRGYLLYSDAPGTYLESGSVPAAPVAWTTSAGWNLVGLSLGATNPISASTLLKDVLQQSGGSQAGIYGLSNNQWAPALIQTAAGKPVGQDFIVQAGKGYLLYTDRAASISPSTSALPTRERAGIRVSDGEPFTPLPALPAP